MNDAQRRTTRTTAATPFDLDPRTPTTPPGPPFVSTVVPEFALWSSRRSPTTYTVTKCLSVGQSPRFASLHLSCLFPRVSYRSMNPRFLIVSVVLIAIVCSFVRPVCSDCCNNSAYIDSSNQYICFLYGTGIHSHHILREGGLCMYAL